MGRLLGQSRLDFTLESFDLLAEGFLLCAQFGEAAFGEFDFFFRDTPNGDLWVQQLFPLLDLRVGIQCEFGSRVSRGEIERLRARKRGSPSISTVSPCP